MNHTYIAIDGTFLNRPDSLIAVMNIQSHKIISGQYGVSENSISQLLKFLHPFKDKRLNPKSCTVDGNPQLALALKTLWPDILIQRCLVHIQRQGLMWCRINPKRPDAKALRQLFLQVTKIRTLLDRDQFIHKFKEWENYYGSKIKDQPESGWVFSDLKRARSMLVKALPNMFHFIQDANISTSTNGLESYFSRLKSHYRNHRGLLKSKLHNYFKWYLYLCQK